MFGNAKYRIYGTALLAVVAVFVSLCVAVYSKAFTASVPVQVRADRAGLQMYEGNRVQMRGVDVGEVSAVDMTDDGSGANVTLAMNPEMLSQVPANATVSLDQLTGFGAKTVNLGEPQQPSTESLQPGATIAADRVTVEVNNLFDQLTDVLETAQPAKVNAILGGVAETLDGRGEKIGQTVDVVTAYLQKINGDLPGLRENFTKGAEVANLYADVTPNLGGILDNVQTTSRTLVERRAQLTATLEEVKRLSGSGEEFFAQNGDTIVSLADALLPTTRLLNEYSPMFTCFVQGMAEADRRLLQSWGNTVTGLHGLTTFVPGVSPYKNPENLPEIGADNGPDCYGLPNMDGHTVPESLLKPMDKGYPGDPFERTNRVGDPPLDAQLFGPRPAPGAPQAQVPTEGGEGE